MSLIKLQHGVRCRSFTCVPAPSRPTTASSHENNLFLPLETLRWLSAAHLLGAIVRKSMSIMYWKMCVCKSLNYFFWVRKSSVFNEGHTIRRYCLDNVKLSAAWFDSVYWLDSAAAEWEHWLCLCLCLHLQLSWIHFDDCTLLHHSSSSSSCKTHPSHRATTP